MAHKAKNGGTIGRAPIGYLNARIDIEGRQVNSVIVDQDRAPLVRLAFELYATGDYSIDALQLAMEDHGLRARPVGRWRSERPLSANTLHRILGDPYYAGYTVYDGELYDGRHEALVTQEVFDRVQQVLDDRSGADNRDRVLHHYLKGVLRCDRCRVAGRTSRLIYTEAKGRGGTYRYYLCRGRQEGVCDLPHLPVDQVEFQVQEYYRSIELTDDFANEFSAALEESLEDHTRSTKELQSHLRAELAKLAEQENALLDALADPLMPHAKIRARINDIAMKRVRIAERMDAVQSDLLAGARVLTASLDLSRRPYELYARATDDGRSQINRAFFHALYITEHGSVAEARLTEPFIAIFAAHRVWLAIPSATRKQRSAIGEALQASLTAMDDDPRHGEGSSKTVMVDVKGLEPLTSRV
ncbi:recombinase family protein [Calidifontibacter indicus]|uniref:recombinase family protein n=1 Tax=Calidifontibacter indicus TaxID=419650 RepID=UPI003CCC869A